MATQAPRDPRPARTPTEQLRSLRAYRSAAERVLSRALMATAFLVVAFAAIPARAEPEFPGKLQTILATIKPGVCTPSCMLCHTDPAGGEKYLRSVGDTGTVWAIFLGNYVKSNNAMAVANLKSDTDGDTVSDIDELLAGTDPLVKGSPSICSPEYGCGARVAPAPPSYRGAAGVAALFAAAVAAYFVRRPRHTPRR
jgi:hypothetical protein